jgi:hypothetical protein
MLLANSKMSDKLQFVVAIGSGRVAKTSDKLKFVGHFHRPFALLSNSPTVSAWLEKGKKYPLALASERRAA